MELGHLPAQPSQEFKEKLERAIWGPLDGTTADPATPDGSPPLDCFFKYCQSEVREPALGSVVSAMAILRTKSDKSRHDLNTLVDNPALIDLCLRLMLMTGCSSRGMGGAVFRRRWMDHETPAEYLARILPQNSTQSSTHGQINGSQALSLDKLTADYLKRYASVEVEWTDHVTDHLLLLKGSDWKKVYIFAHPAFLLRSIEVLSQTRDHPGSSGAAGTSKVSDLFAQSLPQGCLPLSLLQETLLTLEILFPPVGDSRSQRLLATDVEKENLDPMLLRTVQFHASTSDDADDVQKLTDVHSLYDQFPFWGARLHVLWQEAEEPTPTSFIGRLGDRKKSPRFMWWCGLMAILVAIMFGIVSTVLAAAQVWISYCSWMGDANVLWCGLKEGHGG